MNIREFVNARRLQRISLDLNSTFPPHSHFSPPDTDVYASPDRKLMLAINRQTGRFIAQQSGNCVGGFVREDLTQEEISLLGSPSL